MAVDAGVVAGLVRVLDEYEGARADAMQGHPVAAVLTSGVPAALREFGRDNYRIKGSAGQFGRWARCPWVALFDPRITTGASHGFYVVFLFRITPGRESVHLSLNQATTEARELTGSTAAAERMLRNNARQYANAYADLIPVDAQLGPIDLDAGGNDFARGYELGNISSHEFPLPQLRAMTDAEVMAPLDDLLVAYREMADDFVRDGELGRGRRRKVLDPVTAGGGRQEAAQPKTRIPLAEVTTQSWTTQRPPGAKTAEPREANLLAQLTSRLESHGLIVERGRYETPDGDVLYSDAVVDELSALFEAKAANSRECVRMAIGQLIDYGRFDDAELGVVVLGAAPLGDDIYALIETAGYSLMFPQDGKWRARGPIRDAMAAYAQRRRNAR